jgi:hypothetical protein
MEENKCMQCENPLLKGLHTCEKGRYLVGIDPYEIHIFKEEGHEVVTKVGIATFANPAEEPTQNKDGSYTYNMKIVEDDN